MKKWNTPDLMELNINETAGGFGKNYYEEDVEVQGIFSGIAWVFSDDAKKPVTAPSGK